MTPLEMMEELRLRREYDVELDKRLEEHGEGREELEREVNMLRALLSRQIIGIMLGGPAQEGN